MAREDCDIQRKLKVLRNARKIGHAARTCRYFGVGRPSVYRWKTIQVQSGEARLFNAKLIQKTLSTTPRLISSAPIDQLSRSS
ncbi:hypothetical protein H7F50_13860 [Novosphingobium flavum]|uniref:hypothetical protein n=1 Tax=Novosphingobium aerophilum TaxID=2839843 RepID=UPI001639FBFF|nr:hypothetical protein [Novosphingobium aerophilum]MBC2662839.1 hypothetical protein [Novosphingobium aerophilum]